MRITALFLSLAFLVSSAFSSTTHALGLLNFGIGQSYTPSAVAAAFNHISSVDLDGSTEYLQNSTLQSIGIANSWTVNIWTSRPDIDAYGYIFATQPTPSPNDKLFIAGLSATTGFQVAAWNSLGTLFKNWTTATGTFGTGSTTMISATWDGSNLKVYSNGSDVSAGATKSTDNAGTMTDTNREIEIGHANAGNLYKGKISGVSLWDTALDATAISDIYSSGSGYTLDLREATGTAYSGSYLTSLEHFWPICKDTADIGQDLGTGTGIDIAVNAANITSADCIDF